VRIRILLASIALAAALSAAADEPFRVIVNPGNAAAGISLHELSQLFLKKKTRWPSGEVVQPVEPGDERLRARFAEKVHRKSLNAVKAYWNQVIFSGRDVPPVEKPSDDDVAAYVRANAGAVGYVSPLATPAGVKTLAVKD